MDMYTTATGNVGQLSPPPAFFVQAVFTSIIRHINTYSKRFTAMTVPDGLLLFFMFFLFMGDLAKRRVLSNLTPVGSNYI